MFGEKNLLTLVEQYANIGNQIKFINTIKILSTIFVLPSLKYRRNGKVKHKDSCEKFIRKHSLFSKTFDSLSDEKKGCVLDYLSGTKRVASYEMIRSYEDLDAVPPKEFFAKTEFYSTLKNETLRPE